MNVLKEEMTFCGSGYNEEFNLAYDEKIIHENTKIYIVAPKIGKEESYKIWANFYETASNVLYDMVAKGIDVNHKTLILDFLTEIRQEPHYKAYY